MGPICITISENLSIVYLKLHLLTIWLHIALTVIDVYCTVYILYMAHNQGLSFDEKHPYATESYALPTIPSSPAGQPASVF